MDPNLYQAARQLPPGDARVAQLYRLATSPAHPEALAEKTRKALFMVAALLLASGLIFWIAANWQEQTRMFKLLLIEGALLVSVLASVFWRRGRVAALLCATLALGGLLAFVGQTYQTGADAWQLFATWAGLALIWTVLARSDLLWTLWIAIVATGIGMWWGHFDLWEMLFSGARVVTLQAIFFGLWMAVALVPFLVSLSAWTRLRNGDEHGMPWWSHRFAWALALSSFVVIALYDLFTREGSGLAFPLSGALIAASLVLSYQGRLQDFASLCLGALAANAWVMALAVKVVSQGTGDTGAFLILTIVGIGCLAATVSGLLAVQRRFRVQHDAARIAQEGAAA